MSPVGARNLQGLFPSAGFARPESWFTAVAAPVGLVYPRRLAGGCAGLLVKAAAGAGSGGSVGVEKVNGRKINGINGWVEETSRDVPSHATLRMGRFVEERFVYRQTFVIRSYEIGPDKTATMETLMNLLQETALNHVMTSGLAGDGFGATREMSLRKLIWVVTRIRIQVDKYSRWGDVVEIDTWVDAAGKNGMRRDWMIRDYATGEIIARATSTWVIMNRETRRLSKIPEPVREEVMPFYLGRTIIHDCSGPDAARIHKLDDETAQSIKSGLAPRWSDMDANQHVNNVKYISWILESVPVEVLEEHSLASMTLEYRRECRQSQLLESLTSLGTQLAAGTTAAAPPPTSVASTCSGWKKIRLRSSGRERNGGRRRSCRSSRTDLPLSFL